MRVKLKGINRVRKRLADGRIALYHYAWKGGPRLDGEPGSPEFIASYHAAVASRRPTHEGTIQSLLDAFEESADFRALGDRTRSDYKKHLKILEADYGDFPLAALTDRRARGEFRGWRDKRALRSRRQADYVFATLRRILSWAYDRGLAPANPCERAGRVYRANRRDSVWSDADEASFYAKAPPHLHLALRLALWTGQRQGDLLRLTWSAYDGACIRLRQRKTRAPVVVPVGTPLRAALDETRRKLAELGENKPLPLTMLATTDGTAWTESGFRASWRKACAKAGVIGLTFHDLRGTAVTRLAVAGCTAPEIAAITGHSIKDVGAILDSHYLHRDPKLAESAIAKLERGTKLPTERPTAV